MSHDKESKAEKDSVTYIERDDELDVSHLLILDRFWSEHKDEGTYLTLHVEELHMKIHGVSRENINELANYIMNNRCILESIIYYVMSSLKLDDRSKFKIEKALQKDEVWFETSDVDDHSELIPVTNEHLSSHERYLQVKDKLDENGILRLD